jgi:hypothetical protein
LFLFHKSSELVFYLYSLFCIQLTILCFILLHVVARCHLLWFLCSSTNSSQTGQ